MYAAKQGNLAMVRTLIENGHADASIVENVYCLVVAIVLKLLCCLFNSTVQSLECHSLLWKVK